VHSIFWKAFFEVQFQFPTSTNVSPALNNPTLQLRLRPRIARKLPAKNHQQISDGCEFLNRYTWYKSANSDAEVVSRAAMAVYGSR
jgi:hypothetical protein